MFPWNIVVLVKAAFELTHPVVTKLHAIWCSDVTMNFSDCKDLDAWSPGNLRQLHIGALSLHSWRIRESQACLDQGQHHADGGLAHQSLVLRLWSELWRSGNFEVTIRVRRSILRGQKIDHNVPSSTSRVRLLYENGTVTWLKKHVALSSVWLMAWMIPMAKMWQFCATPADVVLPCCLKCLTSNADLLK